MCDKIKAKNLTKIIRKIELRFMSNLSPSIFVLSISFIVPLVSSNKSEKFTEKTQNPEEIREIRKVL